MSYDRTYYEHGDIVHEHREIVGYTVIDHFTFQVNLGTGTLTKAFDKKTGLADPYVRIGKKLTPFWDWKSQKCRNTLNPEWCETGSFKLTRTDGDSITLAIEMMDYDEGLFDLDDFVGRKEIDGIAGWNGPMQLLTKKGECYGTINNITITATLSHTERIPIYRTTDTTVERGYGHHHGHSHYEYD